MRLEHAAEPEGEIGRGDDGHARLHMRGVHRGREGREIPDAIGGRNRDLLHARHVDELVVALDVPSRPHLALVAEYVAVRKDSIPRGHDDARVMVHAIDDRHACHTSSTTVRTRWGGPRRASPAGHPERLQRILPFPEPPRDELPPAGRPAEPFMSDRPFVPAAAFAAIDPFEGPARPEPDA